jgi:predicted GNAT family acetyltransferase
MIGELTLLKPVFALVEAGAAVSICCSARSTERAAEAGIETLEQSRGRGYAAEVASMWADEIRDSGRIPLFSTSWRNRASLRVAGKLCLVQYGVDAHIE